VVKVVAVALRGEQGFADHVLQFAHVTGP
jgi:hypothetical protein